MSSEQSVMRTSLLPGLIDAVKKNTARQQDAGRLFEVGLVFKPVAGLQQDLIVGGILWGRRDLEAWHSNTAAVDFFDAKGVVEELGHKVKLISEDALEEQLEASLVIEGNLKTLE